MQENTSSATDSLKTGNRVVAGGITAIVLILLGAAVFLFLNLPDANATTLIFPWLNLYEQGYADVPTQNFREVLKHLKIYVPNV